MDNRIRIMALVTACKNIKELKLIINLIKRTEYDHLLEGIEVKPRDLKHKNKNKVKK